MLDGWNNLMIRTGMVAASGLVLSWSWAAAQTAPSSDSVSQPAMIAPNPATAAASDSVDAQIAAWTAAPPAPAEGAPLADPNAAAAARQIHGQAGVGFGSNGYRQAFVTAQGPVGSDGTLGVGVSETQFKIRDGPTVKDTSLAVSLMLGGAKVDPGCEALRVNNQTVEPLWVTHLRGAPLGPDAAPCGR